MKKISTRALLIGIGVLAAIFVGSRFFRSQRLETNIRKDLVTLDTASVTEIRILPSKDRTNEVRLVRDGSHWKAKLGERTESANRTAVTGILGTLTDLRTLRMVSRKKDKWNEFKVGDSSTHVSVFKGARVVADLHVGKLGFVMANGSFGGVFTYVRLDGEDAVYTVDGYLEPSFNNAFTDWRDKTVLNIRKEDITSISLKYPLDSGFVVSKRDSVWHVGQQVISEPAISQFIQPFTSKYLSDFADDFKPTAPADVVITIDGKSGNLATVEAWKQSDAWILTSSLQKGIYFTSTRQGISDLLVGRRKLLINH